VRSVPPSHRPPVSEPTITSLPRAEQPAQRAPGPETLRHHDAMLGALRGGLPRPAGRARDRRAGQLRLSFARQEASLPFGTADETADLARAISAGFDGHYPHLAS
jgi:hypothetical protein